MTSARRHGAWMGMVFLLLTLVAVPFAFYFYFYIEGQREYFEKRSFRALTELEKMFQERVSHLYPLLLHAPFDQPAPNNTTPEPQGCKSERPPTRGAELYLTDLKKNPIYRRIWLKHHTTRDAECTDSDRAILHIERHSAEASLRADVCKHWNGPCTHPSLTIPLNDLLPELATEDFDQILVADHEGRVLAARMHGPGSDSIDVAGIGWLIGDPSPAAASPNRDGAGAAESVGRPRSDTAAIERVPVGTGNALFFMNPMRLPFPVRRSDSRLTSRTVINNSHDWQAAVTVDSREPASQERAPLFYLVGVVDESRFEAQVRRVPLTALGVFCLVLTLGILSWPYAKLRLRGPRERLRPIDAYGILISLILGGALVTIFLLDVVAYRGMRAFLDKQAIGIATKLESELSEEIQDVARGLRRLPIWPNPLPDNVCTRAVPYELAFRLNARGAQFGMTDDRRVRPAQSTIWAGDRTYFQRVKNDDTWLWADGDRVFVEPITTYSLGFKLTAVAMPADPRSAGGDGGPEVVVGLRRILSTWNPILPEGFSFAVFSNENFQVLYDPTEGSGLLTNMLAETDFSQSLQGAVAMRRSAKLDINRHGMPRRIITLPMAKLPWTVAVLYDLNLVRAMIFEMAVLSAAATLLYALGLAGFVWALSSMTAPTRWAWLWPVPSHSRRYVLGSAAVGMLLLYQVVGLIYLTHWWPALQLAAGPLATCTFAYLLLGSKRRPKLVRAAEVALAVALGLLALLAYGMPSLVGVVIVLFAWAVLALVLARCLRDLTDDTTAGCGRRLSRRYVAFAGACLLSLSAVPGAITFRSAFALYSESFGRLNQQTALTQMEQRIRGLNEEAKRLQQPYPSEASPTQVCVGYFGRSRVNWGKGHFCQPPHKEGLAPPASDSAKPECNGANRWKCALPVPSCPDLIDRCHDDDRSLLRPLAQLFPVYSDTTARLRNSFRNVPSGPAESEAGPPEGNRHRWSFARHPNGTDYLRLTYESRSLGTAHATSDVIGLGTNLPAWETVLIAALFAAFLLAYAGIVWSVAQRMLGLGVPDLSRNPSLIPAAPSRRRILVGDSDRALKDLPLHCGEIQRQLTAGVVVAGSATSPRLVVHHFEALNDQRKARLELLSRLENHLTQQTHELVIMSRVPPDRVVDRALSDSATTMAAAVAHERRRWLDVFAKCTLEYTCVDGLASQTTTPVDDVPSQTTRPVDGLPSKKTPPVEDPLAEECAWLLDPEPIAEIVRACGNKRPLTREEIVDLVGSHALPLYRKIWSECSMEERMVLYGLARRDLPNPQSPELRELLRRGLVVRDPDIKLPNASFAEFVLHAEPARVWHDWESQVAPSAWSIVRWPLLVTFAMASFFIAYSGGPVLESAVALVPVGVASLPILLQVAKSLRVANVDPDGPRPTELA